MQVWAGRCSHRASGSTSSCLPHRLLSSPGGQEVGCSRDSVAGRTQGRGKRWQHCWPPVALQKHGDWQPAVMRRRTGVGPGRERTPHLLPEILSGCPFQVNLCRSFLGSISGYSKTASHAFSIVVVLFYPTEGAQELIEFYKVYEVF